MTNANHDRLLVAGVVAAELCRYVEGIIGTDRMPLALLKTPVGTPADVCEVLGTLPTDVQREIYVRAQSDILSESQKRYVHTRWHIWFLSHPTFAVFTAFLRDRNLCEALSDYVEAVAACKFDARRQGISRSHLKQAVRGRDLHARLTGPYLALIRQAHDAALILLLSLGEAPYTYLSLNIVQQHSEQAMQTVYATLITRCVREWVARQGTQTWSDVNGVTLYCLSRDERVLYSAVAGELSAILTHTGTPVHFESHRFGKQFQRHHADVYSRVNFVLEKGGWPRFERSQVNGRVNTSLIPADARAHNRYCIGAQAAAVLSSRSRHMVELRTVHGRLPIGLKIHVLHTTQQDWQQARHSVQALRSQLSRVPFRAGPAEEAFVMEPVGNVESAVERVQALEEQTGLSIMDNPQRFQLQVCSQGRLTGMRPALLGTAFYLASDRIREPDSRMLGTSHEDMTGKRLILYDAGEQATCFPWLGVDSDGKPCVKMSGVVAKGRTDVLWCNSQLDIANVNLVATLLAHDEFGGYWQYLGRYFVEGLQKLLAAYQLESVLAVPWIHTHRHNVTKDDERFGLVFQELYAHARDETQQLQAGRVRAEDTLLGRVAALLNECDEVMRKLEV